MGQVPTKTTQTEGLQYALIGSGKLARHLKHYFLMKKLKLNLWSRNRNPDYNTLPIEEYYNGFDRLRATLQNSQVVLLALSDRSLESFVNFNKQILEGKTLVHFSGAKVLTGIQSAHPLMTFGENLYDKATYENIPFILEKNGKDFKDLFPLLANPYFTVDPVLKPLYHSYCVMAGNFTVILWQEVFKRFHKNLGLPQESLTPYLIQTFKNLLSDPHNALTGPLDRNDLETIQNNLVALSQDQLLGLYEAFVTFKLQQQEKQKQPTV